MQNLINIASEEKNPVFIDAASVTAFYLDTDKKELSVFSAKGRMLWIDYERDGVDPAELVRKLAEAGNKLVAFPARHATGENAHYVSPSAVTFATVIDVEANGTFSVSAGIKGEGVVQNYGTKPEQLQSLLDGMKEAGKTVLEHKPDAAQSLLYNAEAIYIDPASVTSVRDNGRLVTVYFDATGPLEVETRRSTEQKNDRETEVLNELWDPDGTGKIKELRDAWKETSRIVEDEENQARRDFAAGIAAANGTLTQVSNTARGLYIRPEDFAAISFYDDDKKDAAAGYKYTMILEPQKTRDNPYPERVSAYFNSASDRAASFKALTGVDAPKPAEKKPAVLKP